MGKRGHGMKAVLISIKPNWCELIAQGKKTVEVRKTKPKLETPFKVYIYCTLPPQKELFTHGCIREYANELIRLQDGRIVYDYGMRLCCDIENRPYSQDNFLCKKVIGEFVCDEIYDITPHFDTPTFPNQYICGWEYGKEFDCLSFEELTAYLKGKNGYGWHISNLVIYDKPRELSEFYTLKKCNACKGGYESSACIYDDNCKVPAPITRPPQSWCYVEVEE